MISKKQIEDVLCSRGKLRVLRELAKGEPLSMYMLERKTGIRSVYLKSDVHYLVRIGWVIKVGDRVSRFTLNFKDELVRKTIEFLSGIGYTQDEV